MTSQNRSYHGALEMQKGLLPDPKDAAKAGREGWCLLVQKLNPLKKPASERFDSWVTGKQGNMKGTKRK